MSIFYAVIGLAILLLAGDALVRGAVNLGLRLGIPALIVSLTVVAFGTSAPELLIAIKAAMAGLPGIAFGNVVGSNTANVLMVLGIPAMLAGISLAGCDTRKTYLQMLGATVVFIGLAFLGPFYILHGIILLALLAAMLTDSFFTARRHRNLANECVPSTDLDEIDEADPEMPGWKIAMFLLLGLIGLPCGADLLVDGAIGVARHFGISEAVIGLTLVAIGTSLPELATTIIAALRRHGDVAIGNVIGSNMFNLLGIMGIASFFGPLAVPPGILAVDIWVMLASTLLLLPFVFGGLNITRSWGALLSATYIGYMVFLLA
jgi:cation:H+ antiporter